MEWIAYLSLAASTVFALLRPDRRPASVSVTLALVVGGRRPGST